MSVYRCMNSDGISVELRECDHKPGFKYVVLVGGSISGYCENIRDAYRFYNECAR